MEQEAKKVVDVVAEVGLPFRRIKALLEKPKLKPEDLLSEKDIAFLLYQKKATEVKTLTKAEKKKKIRLREKANDKSPKQENPFAPKGATKFSKPITIKTPTGGKVR